MEYFLGIGAAFAFFMILTVFLYRREKPQPVIYDEMQTAVKGKAYKYSTITGVVAGIIAALLLSMDMLPMDGSFALMTVSFLMITVYLVYMIMKGAYFGISGKWKQWTVLMFAVGLANFLIGALRIREKGIPDGILTMVHINIMIGLLFMVIVATVLIQKITEKKDED